MSKLKLTHYSDNAHSWYRVTRDLVTIAEKYGLTVTPFSYEKNNYVYLEEDVDAPNFFKIIPIELFSVVENHSFNKLSSIRGFKEYKKVTSYD